MEALISVQHELAGRISRTYENVKKVGVAKINRSLIATTLKLLDNKWEKFEEQHERLRTKYGEEIRKHEYYTKDVMGQVEQIYVEQRAALLEHEESLSPLKVDDKNATREPPPRTTLPRIQLPTFSGKYEDWPSFRDLFLSLIGRDTTLSDVTKLHYLKVTLKGEAELLVRNLPTIDENFDRAWQVLKTYYENTRLLVRSYYSAFTSLPKLKTESAKDLRKLFHCVSSTAGALESIGRPIASSEDLFVFLTIEMLDPRSRLEWENQLGRKTDPPSYKELREFLECRLHTLEAMQPPKPESSSTSTKAGDRSPRSARSYLTRKQDRTKDQCPLCHKDHFLMLCDAYKTKSPADRKQLVEERRLCFNCLGKHKMSECSSKKTCSVCANRHHSSLHDAFRAPANTAEVAKTSHLAHRPCEGRMAVLLATARVRVADRSGVPHTARALIDQGSEASIITETLAQRLRLPRSQSSVAVFGVGGRQTGVARGQVSLSISPRNGGRTITVPAIVLPRLTVYAGLTSVVTKEWPHLRELDLADPEFLADDSIDMLLGADVYAAILEPGVIKGGQREPVAQRTSLGWIVSGAVGTLTSHNATSALQCHVDEPLSTLVRRFWEQEEVRPEPTPMTSDERECEELFVRTVARNSDGRYVVRLPLSSPLPDLAGSRLPATRMLLHMEKRFEHVADLKTLYHDFMHQYEAMNHMTRAEPLDHSRKQVCYLPHHGVMKDTSTSTKLRVVFNGSLSSPSGDSLNKHLMTGPNLLPPLADILLRWRWHRYVFSADVEKMYRQILVHPDDRDLQRIVWREDRAKPIEEYQLNTVTYGLACAPFLAIRTLRQLADDEESEFPLGAPILRRDVYMDDVLSGAATSAEARDALCQLSGMCMAGGFPLKKWAANEPSLLNGIPDEDRSRPDTCAWLSHHNHSALGLQWNSGLDSLSFTIRPVKEERITKRSVLSQAARLFDPLGWLAPVVVRAKIIIQSTWLQGLDWDTPLPDADAARWRQLQSELPLLADIRVPRWLHSSPSDEAIEVHGFADASERAYAAAVYLRTVTKESVNVTLMMAKTKVAPIKQVSLPRLELCAAALLTKLIAHILTVLNLKVQPVHLWSDSTVTLGWIHGHPSRWVTYVANRVSEIQTLLPQARWHHVSGADNPADCASRGLSPGELESHPLWWQGPTWLRERDDFWDSRPAVMEDEAALPEQRTQVHTGATQPASEETSMLARYASLSRLLRITAWCRRWLRVRDDKLGSSSLSGELSSEEIDRSLCGWVRMVQSVHFKDELEDCKKGKTVSRRSILTKLSPFIDDQGILRVGGRIKHSLLAYDERHPMILPTTTPLTTLMIGSCHARTLHGGVQQTLGLLRQRFWIPRGRAVVKSHLHRCLQCLRWRAATPRQTMADLPRSRVTPSRPFLHTGVDYAGPILLRATKGRGHKTGKAFIAVFICFSTRAIHIEVVSDYTAAAFLAALRRFTARRGLCQVLYSDCGTTFTGADAELRALFTASNKEARRIQHALADEHIQWRFNPPAAPHFGGLWEAAVKSIKHHLRRVVGDSTLTYEEMSTFLAQVEACLNSRPLQALTDDPEDMAALTPGHFLVGAPLTAIPEPSLLDTPINRLSRWQHVQRMRDHFWDRWSQEYIHGLIPRQKWWKDNAALKEGQLCLIRNENTPASRWPLARISALHPGKDGRVRVVTLRTATSELTRPINKIVLLPVHSATEVEKQ